MKCNICQKKVISIKSLLTHIRRTHNMSSEEYYLKYIGEKGKCAICKKETRYRNINVGYSKVCKEHVGKYGGLKAKEYFDAMSTEQKKKHFQYVTEQYNAKSEAEKQLIKEKRKKSNLEKYGVENVMHNNNIVQKLKDTRIEFSIEKLENIQQKRIETTLKKYGVEHIHKLPEIKRKTRKTKMDRYGSCNNYEKIKQTKLQRYGNKNYNNNKQRLKTFQEKYGGLGLQSKEIQDKAKKTKRERYGDENYNNFNKVKKTKRERYGDENYSNRVKAKETQKRTIYERLFSTNRLQNKVEPLFGLEEYLGNAYNIKYTFRCNECQTEFNDRLYSGHIPRCPECYPRVSSKPEHEIYEYINKLLPAKEIIKNSRSIIAPLELDIYIPELKIAIEHNGLYHHSELNGVGKEYHLNKTILCEKQGIQLIHIFEDEWLNKEEIVKLRLKHILGLSENKIYARKCEIKEIDSRIKNNFLEQYHIQGKDRSKIKLGLFYNDKLISVMTFGALRRSLGSKLESGSFELIRFATKENVIGGGSKLLNYFVKNYSPKKIISYADRRWSTGNFYEKIGFTKVSDGVPNYWYLIGYSFREHRFNYRKQVLNEKLDSFNSDLTEWENMQLNGYDRIWDCGSLKYEMIVKD